MNDMVDHLARKRKSASPADDISVAIIEPRALLRDYMARGFAASCPYGLVTVPDLAACLELIAHNPPSVVLLCGSGSDPEDVRAALRQLKEAARDLPVIVQADDEDAQVILDYLACGADGYIPTSLSLDVVVEAVRLVRAGGVFIPAESLSRLHQQRDRGVRGRNENIKTMFTDRQGVVAEGLRRGKPNKIIAYELNVSESTVKVHVRNIMKKLHANNRTEVAFIINELYTKGRLAL